MSDIPRVPASFINEIAENGTKEEALSYLQNVWNERCYLQDQVQRLKEAMRRMQRASQEAADYISEYARMAK